MSVERSQSALPAKREDVVEKYTHLHTSVGGAQCLARQQSTRQVAVPGVILQIEAVASRLCRCRTQRKCLSSIRHQGRPTINATKLMKR
ncbi:hypothetical protein [Dankookia sp. P2]|uniref:hypothetical protein n=1 Tax=Dankookia sp. P2 TaxID=3423955 RepID=UPI003D673764